MKRKNKQHTHQIVYEGRKTRLDKTWKHIQQRMFRANRKHKDRLFILLFSEPTVLLQLYNALNHSHYTDPADLIITTLEDAVYLGMKNDCSFLIGNYLNLYEHQSTFNPNMPLRGFLYFASVLQGYLAVKEEDVFGTKLVKIPTPRYVVFYNGTSDFPDVTELRLSDAFETAGGCMEFTARMLNINLGHNQELMEQCKLLGEYAAFIDKIRGYQNRGCDTETAIDMACADCIKQGILKDFLLKNRNEVRRLILTEYDEKKHLRNVRQEGKEEGLEQGREQGLELITLMIQNGQIQDIQRLKEDKAFFREMMRKYHIE